jgi:hypothetical protein
MILASLTSLESLDSRLVVPLIPFNSVCEERYVSVFSDKGIRLANETVRLNIAYSSHPYSIRPSYRSVATLDTSKAGERTYLLALQHQSLLSLPINITTININASTNSSMIDGVSNIDVSRMHQYA